MPTVTSIDATVRPDGTPVAVTASNDKTVRVPDGSPIVVAFGGRNAWVWRLQDGAELGRFDQSGKLIAGLALPDRTLILGEDFHSVAVHTLK
jgi:hypothetical protein